jgi:Flp pilus assembly protein TadD
MTPRAALAVALALCTLILAACGEGGGAAPSGARRDAPPSGSPAPPPSEAARRSMNAAAELYRQGKFDRALQSAIAALEESPRSTEPYRLVSKIFTDTGRNREGIEFFSGITRRDPQREQAWLYKGFREFHLNLWEPALASFRQASSLEPRDAEAHSRSGMILEYMGDLDAAAVEFRAAYELEPASPRYATRHAKALRMSGDYAGAERVIAEALALAPQSGDLHYALAQIRLRQRRSADAEQALRRTIELDPQNAEARKDLAGVLARAGNEAEARAELAVADRLNDYERTRRLLLERVGAKADDPLLAVLLAELELTAGRLDPALQWYARAEALGGSEARIRSGRAEALFLAGRPAEGQAELSRISDGPDPRVSMARAAASSQLGDVERALDLAEEAVAVAQVDRNILLRASDLYARAGRSAESRELARRAAATPRPPTP